MLNPLAIPGQRKDSHKAATIGRGGDPPRRNRPISEPVLPLACAFAPVAHKLPLPFPTPFPYA